VKVMVLGSAAGGGFPQWNCNCNNCCGVRSGSLDAIPRTQSSIAVSVDGERWILFNASPDIRSQLEANPPLQPKRGRRDTGVHGVVLADSQIDHTTGLLFLREGCPLRVYCTDMVAQDLSTGFPIFVMLQSWDGGVIHTTIPIDGSAFQVIDIEEISITAIPLDGKAPPYSPHRHDPHVGDNVGYLIEDTRSQASLFYAPGLGQMSSALLDMMGGAD
jgi:pyrroloquinoline quinone biosynthesis protein B